MALSVSKHHKTFLVIDGARVDFLIARLTHNEMSEYTSMFDKFGKDYERRQRELEPQTEEEKGLNELQLRARREADLTSEQREQKRLEELEHEKEGNEFAAAAIIAYVKPSHQAIHDSDTNTYLTTGEELVDYFGSRADVMRDLVAEIYMQNRFTEDAKKNLKLLRASSLGSNAPAVPGATPAPTVESAAPPISAETAAATA